MREIKFRAWVKDEKCKSWTFGKTMLDVSDINFYSKRILVKRITNGAEIIGTREVVLEYGLDDVELMQFTGLHDKNGKEIYEGDILELGNYRYSFVVKWSVPDISFVVYDPEGQSNHSLTDFAFSYLEIIGNIYENPELLEVKE